MPSPSQRSDEDAVIVDYDVGLLDKVVRHRRWRVEDDQGKVTTRQQNRHDNLPEDLMAALEDHLGDAMAKVTIGDELGHSIEYGCKAGSFVSITVHCNADEETIGKVKAILQQKVREFTNDDLKEMKEDRDRHMGKTPPKSEGRVARQPAASGRAKPKGQSKDKPKGKVRARPSYRR